MKLKRWLVFTAISDHSLAPLDLNLTPAERDLAAHMQAQRDYHHHNRTLDGKA